LYESFLKYRGRYAMNTYTMRFGDNSVEYSCFVGNNKILYLKAEMATYLDPAALKIRM